MNTQKTEDGTLFKSAELFGVSVGLPVANFAFQLFTDQDWAAATERSYIQFTALLAVWIVGFICQPNAEVRHGMDEMRELLDPPRHKRQRKTD